jgi:hypothetical protein
MSDSESNRQLGARCSRYTYKERMFYITCIVSLNQGSARPVF